MPVPCKKSFLVFFLFLALVVMFSAKWAWAQDDTDSSACISCHTDLEEMDDYGAKAASAAAAVAG